MIQHSDDGRRQTTRREALAIGALALPTLGYAPNTSGAVDVHSHYSPPSLRDAESAALNGMTGVPPQIRDWTPDRTLEAMDKNGVMTAVVNASWRPALLTQTPDARRAAAREANEFAARMRQDHPKRFQQFTFLPMPDTDASLAEIAYGMDQLGAAGVGLMTSYDGKWLGDPSFAPILAELDRRGAVVFCHPHTAPCCGALMPEISADEGGLLEFPFDTGRAAFALLVSGAFARYSRIRWIFCHCGGPIPSLAGRIAHTIEQLPPDRLAVIAPQGVDHELQRQYYDTANAAYAPSLGALLAYVPPTQVLFGSDFPYVSLDENMAELARRQLGPKLSDAIRHTNAARLFQGLGA